MADPTVLTEDRRLPVDPRYGLLEFQALQMGLFLYKDAKQARAAAKILKQDVMVSPAYVNVGDAVNIIVTVWDLRSNSSYGIRVTSTRLDPAHPENYLGTIVQSVMKQLDDLQRAPTIYRR